MNSKRVKSFSLVLVMLCGMSLADVKLASIFSSDMVLQQGKHIKIWGTAGKGEKITVTLGDKSKTTKALKNGNWSVIFPPRKASFEPLTLTVESKNKIELKNILVGEVWICSGQSNMEWPLIKANNGQQEVAAANYPNIRLCQVGKNIQLSPAHTFTAKWSVCTPQTAASFSAVGYFFGRDLFKSLNVPVGLISSNWGGTMIDAWTPLEYLEKEPTMQHRLANDKPLFDKTTSEEKLKQYTQDMKIYNDAIVQIVKDSESPQAAAKYSAPACDDGAWKTMKVPCGLTEDGLPNYDGYAWFRKTIDVPAKFAGKDLVLHLGPIDEIDITYFNGTEVGRTGSVVPLNVKAWNTPRVYKVPGKLVVAGKNVIAVLVADTVREGGFRGQPADKLYAVFSQVNVKSKKTVNKKIPLAGEWKYLPVVQFPANKPSNPKHPNLCSVLYNGMINPMTAFPVRGVIWYQGESNGSRGYQYRRLMPLMIKAWRYHWDDNGIAFIQTQLANYTPRLPEPAESNWAELREAQLMTAQNDPLVGMAVTIDIGTGNDIHPRNKQDVGKRLALQAEKIVYGKDIPFEGPVFKSMKIEGDKIRLSFDSVFGGLVAKGHKLTGFAIAGPDKKFVWADAKIDGNDVIVWSSKVPAPVAVRYAWANNPECNLYNAAGLPATPFRTDDWPGISVDHN